MYVKCKYEGEDKILYYKDKNVIISILADGHGGDYVSSYIKNNFVKILYDFYLDSLEIKLVVKKTLNKISNDMKNFKEGSTLVGIVCKDDNMILFNIGDSRCYGLLNNNTLKQLTVDHNLYNNNEIKRLKYNINKNDNERRLDGILMMTRSIGDADVKNITSKPYIKSLKVSDYKYIMLLSDGIYEYIDTEKIKNILLRNKNIVKTLFDLSKESTDDRSVLLLKIK
jgi:serine/threonine protein phosphatase PrpC